MNWIKRIFSTTQDKSIQAKSRNKAALECLRALEFGAVEIRQALVGLNGIRVKELARVDGVSAVTIYNTIKGRRTSPKAQELIAQSLNLSVDDLFPAGGTDKRDRLVRGSNGIEPLEPHLQRSTERGCEPARPQPPTGDKNGLAPASDPRHSQNTLPGTEGQ